MINNKLIINNKLMNKLIINHKQNKMISQQMDKIINNKLIIIQYNKI